MDVQFIVTQSLISEVIKFQAYFNNCKKDKTAISIVGPSGVGKSMFLHIFKKLYSKEFPKKPIIETDCSHYAGADAAVARSELFGHVEGAFTGAKKDKPGLIEAAHDGVLILEEVGNLPELVQAMLLTFIETGKYRKIGASQLSAADVWVVAATNDESRLRADLRYRIFPFYIQPLHERRVDVLHYLAFKYPDIIQKLRPFEILALLAHNWRGNVREIERIAKAYEIRTSGIIKLEYAQPFTLYRDNTNFSSFDVSKCSELYFGLKDFGVDVDFLESLLNKYGVGLSTGDKYPFKKFEHLKTDKDRTLDITIVEQNKLFADAWMGFGLYCSLFHQYILSDANLLEISINEVTKGGGWAGGEIQKKNFLKLCNSINNYIDHIKNKRDNDFDLTDMTFDELQKKYFTQLFELEGGHQTRAAKRAGIDRGTLRNNFRRLGLLKC
jgi:DNA-binding NtrC family response regulator